jgi:hypothetical protein
VTRAIACACALGACWTGPDAPATAAPAAPRAAPMDLQVTLERTACFAGCPTYSVMISGEGAVAWHGIANVRELGARRAAVPQAKLRALAAAIDTSRFFELDESGVPGLDERGQCVRNGATTTCSFRSTTIHYCTGTAHAIITIRRGGRVHRIDDAHCEETPLAPLEQLIDDTAGVGRWR